MKYYHIFLMLGALASVTTGCKDETWNYEDSGQKHGTLSARSIEYEVNGAAVISRATDLDDFIVEITDGTEVLDRYAYKDLPNEIDMEVGEYAVCVRTPEIYKAAWDAPYYEGTQTFTIHEDETTEVEKVVCKLANVKVSVRMSDEFRSMVSDDCKLTVNANDNGELVYSLDDIDNGHAGFFEYVPTSQTLVATLDCTIAGEAVSFQTIYTDIEPGQHRIIYYDLGGGEEPVDPTPVDPTPVDPTPTEPVNPVNPVDPTPTDTTTVNPTPVDPVDPTPTDTTTVNPTPVDPVDPTPTDTTTVNPTPVDPVDPTPTDTTTVNPTPVDPVDPTPVTPPTPSGSIELGNGIVIDASTTIVDMTIKYEGENQKPPVDLTDPDYVAPDVPKVPDLPDPPVDPTPTEPTKPTEPEKPTEPTEPTKPTEPEKPTEPTEPTEPTKPTEPEKPTEPTEPTKPIEPEQPVEPVEPEKPAFPTPDASFNLSAWNDVVEGKNYAIKLQSTAGFQNLKVEIDSETLTADILESVGLAATFDLAYPGNLEEGLNGLGFPTGGDVIGEHDVDFVITEFVPLLNIYGAAKHIFRLTMTDVNGKTETIEIKFISTENE